jgi:hypothetical protein
MEDYQFMAKRFDRLAAEHDLMAKFLEGNVDPAYLQINCDLAFAERQHAEACREVSKALHARMTRVNHQRSSVYLIP